MTAFEKMHRSVSIYASFTKDELETLNSFFTPAKLKKGDFFYEQGEVCKLFAFVASGCLRTFYISDKGEEFSIYFAFEGWWIGEPESFYSKGPSRHSCQVLESCELLTADKKNFEAALDAIPPFREFYKRSTQRSYAVAQEKFAKAFSETAEEKYKKLLDKNPEMVLKIPQVHIASYLGVKPQSLSRIRKKILSEKKK